MRRWLLLLLIPLVDALVLVVVAAEFLGALVTVALVVLTGLVGMLLVRAEGRRTVDRIAERLRAGELPADELLDGAMLVAAGAFLLTPGLVTDTLGFLLALPVTRVPVRRLVKKYVVVPAVDRRTDGLASGTVYVGGFPDDADLFGGEGAFGGSNPFDGPDGPGPDPGTGTGSGRDRGTGDVHDLDSDAYDVDIDIDVDEGPEGDDR